MKTNSLSLTRKRLIITVMISCLLFCALSVRLAFIQLIQGKDLQSKAAEQWYRDLPLEAARGEIRDKNGVVLAESKDVYTIYVRPNAVDSAKASVVLGEKLGLDVQKLKEKIDSSGVSEITVMRNVDAAVAESIRDYRLEGVYFTLDKKRSYPFGERMAQILGFTNIDNEGQNGLEGYYNDFLRGVDGAALTASDIKGKELGEAATYLPSVPGCDLTLTVDTKIQAFAEDAVRSAYTEWGAKNAYMIVMDVNTGGITAMAAAPSYDNNEPPRDDMPLLNALSKNKMIVDVYEPGSTFKIFTTAAALEAGAVSESDRFFCPGYRIVDGQRIKCWRTIGHGSQDLSEGVMNSCNCVFMDLAGRLGVDRFYEYLRAFGFGSKTGVDFYGESKGLLMNQSSVKTVDLARIGFGQAVAVTPLQLITGVCAAVNGGLLYEPYFVSSITDVSGKTVYERNPVTVRRVISEETSDVMRKLLTRVVAEGGGSKAGVKGYAIGGKTGTAQKYADGAIAQGKYVSSFIGFAPADDPRYAVLMIVDEPSGYTYYGSIVAAPYAGRTFSRIFEYLSVPPSQSESVAYTVMPELTGMTAADVKAALKSAALNFETACEGETVVSTVPAAGEKLPEGDVVLVRFG